MSTQGLSAGEWDRERAQAYVDLQRAMADIRHGLSVLEAAARQHGTPAKLDVLAGEIHVRSRELARAATQLEVLNEATASTPSRGGGSDEHAG